MNALYTIRGADGQPYGPVPASLLREWIAEGRANENTLAQTSASSAWQPLNAFSDFNDLFNTPPPLAAEPPPLVAPPPVPAARQPVPNYLVPAIVTTFCCCTPVGLAALIFATLSNSRAGAGDYEGALKAAYWARILVWTAFFAFALQILAYSMLSAILFRSPAHF
ncbi:MAG: CD225/dispanin family protein [Verrucomicrobiota bacterium]